MSFELHRALPLIAAVALACPSLANADPKKSQGQLDSFEYTYTLEWSSDEVQSQVKVTRQKDGTYKAELGGEAAVAAPEAAVIKLFKAVRAFQTFPKAGFGGDGNHFHTDVKASGILPGGKAFSFERHFYDPNDERYDRARRALAKAVEDFSDDVHAASAKPGLEAFEYTNTLEWSGDDVQTHVRVSRAADGTYTADVGVGASEKKGLKVPQAAIDKLVGALKAFEKFPDDSFAGDGAHFYTDVRSRVILPGGKLLEVDRWFYDPSDDKAARLQGALASAVEEFEKAVRAANPTKGITAALQLP